MPEQYRTELKIPAEPDFIPVAKRVAASLGGMQHFTLDEIDELTIAVAQACDSTIDATHQMWGHGATLRLTYASTEKGIEVEVEAIAPDSPSALPRPTQSHPAADLEVQRLAQEMIRLFVDDFRSQVDTGRGQVRLRMVKYHLIG